MDGASPPARAAPSPPSTGVVAAVPALTVSRGGRVMTAIPGQGTAERVAEMQRQAAADYAARQAREAAARDQLALARAHGNEQAGTR